MALINWANTVSALPPIDREEDLPYSLPVVLRLEKNVDPPTHEQALLAAIRLITEIFDNEKSVSDPIWSTNLRLWLEGRIRKVVRRARGSAWEKLRNTNEIYINYNGVEILSLPPHPVTETPDVLRNLQVSGLDLLRMDQANHYDLTQKPNLFVTVNDKVAMSTGKAMAQVGHAAQLAIMSNNAQSLIDWKNANFPVSLIETNWLNHTTSGLFVGKNFISIQDAGFTEIEPGTVTTESFLNI